MYKRQTEAIIDKVVDLIKSNKLREISDMRDETDLSGLKLAIDLKLSLIHISAPSAESATRSRRRSLRSRVSKRGFCTEICYQTGRSWQNGKGDGFGLSLIHI